MLPIILWAAATAAISGGTWVGIVMYQRQQALAQDQQALMDDVARRSRALDDAERRFAEIEERLDFAERLLAKQTAPRQLPDGARGE